MKVDIALTVLVVVLFACVPFCVLAGKRIAPRADRVGMALCLFLVGALAGLAFTQWALPRGHACGPLAKGDWMVHCP